MKKIVSLILVLLMTMAILVACGDKTDISQTDDVETRPELDLEGYEFIIVSANDSANPIMAQQYFPIEGDTAAGDAILNRYAELNAKYNMKITEYKTEGWFQAELLKDYAVGKKFGDFINGWNETAFCNYLNGMLESFNDSEFIDLTDAKWGTQYALETLRFDGVNYLGVQPDLWPITERGSGIYNAIIFNPDVINMFQQPNPYELVEQGIWNWQTFEKVTAAMTSPDTVPKDERYYGVSTQHDDFPVCAIHANGGAMVKLVNGRYVYGYNDKEAIDALEWAQKLMYVDKVMFNSVSDWWGSMKLFSKGRSAFHVGRSFFGLTIPSSTEADSVYPSVNLVNGYGWIPFPYGPNSSKDESNIIFDCTERFMTVPLTDDLPMVHRIMDELFEPIPEVGNWREYYRKYIFTDDQAFNMYMTMIDSASAGWLDVWNGWDGRSTAVSALGSLLTSAKKSPAAEMQKMEAKYTSLIDKYLNTPVE